MDDNLIERRRERFEEAYHRQFGRMPQNWNELLGKYFDAHGQGAWWAWNAALDSAVVELPDVYDFHSTSGMRRGCAEAIERAGLRVRS